MKKISLFFALSLLPSAVVFAQSIGNVADVENWVLGILEKINYLLWLVAILAFIWGVIKFIGNANDTAEREKGKSFMIGGIISFVVLASIWGIVAIILQDTFGIFSNPVPYVDKNGVTY